MQRFVTFTMSRGEPYTLTLEAAKQILESDQQLVMITGPDGWTGKTINKAHIVSTDRDIEKEEQWLIQHPAIGIPEHTTRSPEEKAIMKARADKIREEINKVWQSKRDNPPLP